MFKCKLELGAREMRKEQWFYEHNQPKNLKILEIDFLVNVILRQNKMYSFPPRSLFS